MKICYYGFAGYRYLLLELKRISEGIEWGIVLPTHHNKKLFFNEINKSDVCYLFNNFNEVFEKINLEDKYNILKDYGGNFYEDLMSDKGPLKKKDFICQEKYGLTVYLIYKNFLKSFNADFVFFPHMETVDGRILFSTAKELGVKTIVYSHGRNFGVSFFSTEYWQKLPDNIKPSKQNYKNAKEFVKNFKINQTKDVEELDCSNKEEILKIIILKIVFN